MTAEPNEHQITRAEVTRLAGKLQSWAETLPEHEQLVLSWVLSRAQAAGDAAAEVSGYDMYLTLPPPPFPTQLAKAAGFGFDASDASRIILVGGSWRVGNV